MHPRPRDLVLAGVLLIRIIETTTGDTWNNVRRHLDRLHVGSFTGPPAPSAAHELTRPQRDLPPSSPSPRRSRSSSLSPPDPRNDLETLETRPRGVPRRASQVTPGFRPLDPPNYVEPREGGCPEKAQFSHAEPGTSLGSRPYRSSTAPPSPRWRPVTRPRSRPVTDCGPASRPGSTARAGRI